MVERNGFDENGELFRGWKIADYNTQIDLLQKLTGKNEDGGEKEKEDVFNFSQFWKSFLFLHKNDKIVLILGK